MLNRTHDESPGTGKAELVTDAEGLATLCAQLVDGNGFAFDAEFVGEHSYDAEVCLVQVAQGDRVWLIDPLTGLDTTPFWQIVVDDSVEKVVHAGAEDLGIAFRFTGKVPRRVFDVQIAAGLVGPEYPLSLQRLVREVVGVRLHKSQTLSDWRIRPLTAEQIRYAVDDVAHLPLVRRVLSERLQSLGRTSWAEEEFAQFEQRRLYEHTERDRLFRVRGIGSLNRVELATARELVSERETLAKELDRPPRVLLKDYLLVAIARQGWTTPKELSSLRGVNLPKRALEQFAAAVRRGLATPRKDQPIVPKSTIDTTAETMLIKLISTVLFAHSQNENFAHQLLAAKKDVRSLVLARTRPAKEGDGGPLARGWRQRAVGDLIEDLLTGRRVIRIVTTSAGPSLTVE